MEYVLCAENISKQYRNFKALDNLSMHVEKGAIYGFVGRNGAGKTTLIRIICGTVNSFAQIRITEWRPAVSRRWNPTR